MSTSNIKVRDVQSYTEGFNLGYQAAEANRKLTSVTASIMKSVFYRDYQDSFYRGTADGWQHSFDLKKQQIKDNLKKKRQEQAPEKEPSSAVASPIQQDADARNKQYNAKVQEQRQLSSEEKSARLAARQAEAQRLAEQQQRDDQELDR